VHEKKLLWKKDFSWHLCVCVCVCVWERGEVYVDFKFTLSLCVFILVWSLLSIFILHSKLRSICFRSFSVIININVRVLWKLRLVWCVFGFVCFIQIRPCSDFCPTFVVKEHIWIYIILFYLHTFRTIHYKEHACIHVMHFHMLCFFFFFFVWSI